MTAATTSFLNQLASMLERLRDAQVDTIGEAARICATVIASGGLVHVFGSGHSSLVAQDGFGRAGGLIPVNLIVSEDLLSIRGLRAGPIERVSGLAASLLESEPVQAGDALIVVSNSGRNAVPVEMAEIARARGLSTIAITSLAHSSEVASRAPSGKRLYEVVDVVIDNLAARGDAGVRLAGGPQSPVVGPTSTILGAAILQAISVETAATLAASGLEPPVFISANIEGGDAHNAEALRRLKARTPSLLAADISRAHNG